LYLEFFQVYTGSTMKCFGHVSSRLGGGPLPPGVTGELAYYASHGPITHLGPRAPFVDGLPSDLPRLVGVLLGLVLHPVAAARKGMTLSPGRTAELDLRYVQPMLERVMALDPRPLTEQRPRRVA
jgi:hypothetical protein